MYNRYIEAKLHDRMIKKRGEVQKKELILEALDALQEKILSDDNFDSSVDYMRLTNISYVRSDIMKELKR